MRLIMHTFANRIGAAAQVRAAPVRCFCSWRSTSCRNHPEPLTEPPRLAQVSKLFGLPITCALPEDETNFGSCAECRAPRTLLFHLEGQTVSEWSIGDAGWLVIAWCAQHPWDIFCAPFQVP
jgi:hypothetical protein